MPEKPLSQVPTAIFESVAAMAGTNSFSAQLNVGAGSQASNFADWLQVGVQDFSDSSQVNLWGSGPDTGSGSIHVLTIGGTFNHHFTKGDQIQLGLTYSGNTLIASVVIQDSSGSNIFTNTAINFNFGTRSYLLSAYAGLYGAGTPPGGGGTTAAFTYTGSYLVSALLSSGATSGNVYASNTGFCNHYPANQATAEISNLSYTNVQTGNPQTLYYDFK